MSFQVLVVLVIFLNTVVKCDHPTIIGSHLMSDSKIYEVHVAGKDFDQESSVKLMLSAGNYRQNATIKLTDLTNGHIQFNLPAEHHSSYELSVQYSACKTQSIKLINMSRRPIILIQLDKSVYRLEDGKINYQILVLNQNLVPYKVKKDMKLKIQAKNTMHILKYSSHSNTSEFGVHVGFALLTKKFLSGRYTIEVDVDGFKKSKKFWVKKENEHSIQIDLNAPSEVALSYENIYLGLSIKHPENKFFFGSAKITVISEADFQKILNKTIKITKPFTEIKLDINDDMRTYSVDLDKNLTFNVEIFDNSGKPHGKISKNIILRREDLKILTFKKDFFVPGQKFPLKVKVQKINGELDSSLTMLNVNIDFKTQNGTEQHQFITDLDAGLKFINLKPPVSTTEIMHTLTFGEVMLKETIKSIDRVHYIYATINNEKKNYNYNDIVEIFAIISEEISKLFVQVIGPYGVINKEVIGGEKLTDSFKFNITISKLMVPYSTIFTYFIRDDDTVVHDLVLLDIGYPTSNFLDISVHRQANSGEEIEIEVKTKENSRVFLTASENIQEQGHKISSIGNFQYPDSLSLELNKISGVFVIKPSQNCHQNSPLDMTDSHDSYLSETDTLANDYFPNIWFNEEFLMTKSLKKLHKMTPDMPGSWKFHGFSMHPEEGLAITSFSSSITIKKDIWISFKNASSSVLEGELFDVECKVIYFGENDKEVVLKFIVENGDIIDGSKMNAPISETTKLLKFIDKNVIQSKIKIHAKSRGLLTVKVEAERERSEISVIITNAKLKSNKLISLEMTADSGKGTKASFKFNDSESSTETFTASYDSLLGPALDGLDKLFTHQYDYDEYKVDKLAVLIIACKYFKNNEKEEKYLKALEKLLLSREEVVRGLINILSRNDPSSLHIAAYMTENLIESQQFVPDNIDLIEDGINFVQQHFLENGSFTYDDNMNLRRAMGQNIEMINTARILQLFAKSGKHLEKIDKFLNNSINKQSKMFDYENILIAYLSAQINNMDTSKYFFKKINCNYLKQSVKTKFQQFSIFGEVASYKILTELLLDKDPQNDVKWLITQRDINGGFYSPHDTALALRALYEYSEYAKLSGTVFNSDNLSHICKTELPMSSISVQKQKYEFSYQVTYKQSEMEGFQKSFNICVQMKFGNDLWNEIDIVVELDNYNTDPKNSNLVIIEVLLPIGHILDIRSSQLTTDMISKFEVKDDENFLMLYILKMTRNVKNRYKLITRKIFDNNNLGESYVKVYDYYQPNFYNIEYFDNSTSCT